MAAILDRVHELLTTGGEDLAALPPSGNSHQTDDGQGESKADHHAQDKCKHADQRPRREGGGTNPTHLP